MDTDWRATAATRLLFSLASLFFGGVFLLASGGLFCSTLPPGFVMVTALADGFAAFAQQAKVELAAVHVHRCHGNLHGIAQPIGVSRAKAADDVSRPVEAVIVVAQSR